MKGFLFYVVKIKYYLLIFRSKATFLSTLFHRTSYLTPNHFMQLPDQNFTPEIRTGLSVDNFLRIIMGDEISHNGVTTYSYEDLDRSLFGYYNFEINPMMKYVVFRNVKISAGEPINILCEKNIYEDNNWTGFIFSNCILPDIRLETYTAASWYFYQSKIGNLFFGNSTIRSGIFFAESIFDTVAISNHSSFGGITIFQSLVKNLSIKSSNCRDIVVADNSKCFLISIDEKAEAGDILFSNNTTCKTLFLMENSVCGKVEARNNCICDTIRLTGQSIISSVRILESSKCSLISATEESYLEKILAEYNKDDLDIQVIEGSQILDISMKYGKIGSVEIEDNFFNLQLFNTTVLLIKIHRCVLTRFNWNVGNRCEAYITECRIEHISMKQTLFLKDSIISFSDTKVKYIEFEQLTVQGQILLRGITPILEDVDYENLIVHVIEDKPNGTFTNRVWELRTRLLKLKKAVYSRGMRNLRTDYGAVPFCVLSQCSLAKIEITGSDFRKFQFRYYNSKILDSFIIGTQLPKDNFIAYNPYGGELTPKKIFEQETAFYQQLKKIFEGQGDVVEAGWYHSKAMLAQQGLLKLSYQESRLPWYNKWYNDIAFDLFGFWLNKLSNNHGESWRRAINFILITSLIVYSLYYTSIHYNEEFWLGGIGDFIGNYFSFLDLSHRFDFHVPKNKLNAGARVLDYLGKVVIGYGLYQLIVAFRRHGKKM